MSTDPIALATKSSHRWFNLVLILSLCLAIMHMLLEWIKYGLIMPFHNDHEVVVFLSKGYETGQLPYRWFISNQFPGDGYFYWLAARIYGWDAIVVGARLLDLALFLSLCAFLLGLSWILFKSLIAGLVSVLVISSEYTSWDYSMGMQREWHTILLIIPAIFGLAAFGRLRSIRILSAMFVGYAISIRPQSVAYLPVFLFVLSYLDLIIKKRSVSHVICSWIAFLLIMAGTIAASFGPLFMNGLINDFILCISSLSPGRGYMQWNLTERIIEAVKRIENPLLLMEIGLLFILVKTGRLSTQETLLLSTAVFCQISAITHVLISPKLFFAYLKIPQKIAAFSSLTVLLGVLGNLRDREKHNFLTGLSFGIVMAFVSIYFIPFPNNPIIGLKQTISILRDPQNYTNKELMKIYTSMSPVRPEFHNALSYAAFDQTIWSDHAQIVDYLRQTPPHARVANLMNNGLALNSVINRPLAFQGENIVWFTVFLGLVEMREKAINQIVKSSDHIVFSQSYDNSVGDNHEIVNRIHEEIRDSFEMKLSNRHFEVWSRKSESDANVLKE